MSAFIGTFDGCLFHYNLLLFSFSPLLHGLYAPMSHFLRIADAFLRISGAAVSFSLALSLLPYFPVDGFYISRLGGPEEGGKRRRNVLNKCILSAPCFFF